MNLLPQDVLILLKLAVSPTVRSGWTYQGLGHELGLSSSMVHTGLKRAAHARLYDADQRTPNRRALKELLILGVKYVFAPEIGPPTRGIPTAHGAPILRNDVAHDADTIYVWPHHEGWASGIELSPLSKSAPFAAKQDSDLYDALAMLDAIRIGRVRERNIAEERLINLVETHVSPQTPAKS